MRKELSPVSFYPSSWFTDLKDPNSRERFEALMESQYGFSVEATEKNVQELRKELYWRDVAPRVLALVANENHKLFGQLGTILGYLPEKFWVIFSDTVLEPLSEDDILMIEKENISPQAKIKVEFLDDNWERIIRQGELVDYQENKERKGGEPFGWYIVEVGRETQKIEDWAMLGGKNFRFLLEPKEGN